MFYKSGTLVEFWYPEPKPCPIHHVGLKTQEAQAQAQTLLTQTKPEKIPIQIQILPGSCM